MSVRRSRRVVKTGLTALTFTLVVTLIMATQVDAFSTATIYNPLSLSNTVITNGRVGHPVTFFPTWQNQFAIDIVGGGQYADAPIYLWGVGWSTANVGTGTPGNNAHVGWYSFLDSACQISPSPNSPEYAVAYLLNLPSGALAGFSISHLSNYHQAEGALVNQGQQVANLSFLSAGPRDLYAWVNSPTGLVCTRTSTGPHVHVESARNGTTTYNDVDPASGPSGSPSWYYNYP